MGTHVIPLCVGPSKGGLDALVGPWILENAFDSLNGVATVQQNFKCVEFKLPFVIVPLSRRINMFEVGVASMLVGITCPSFILIST